MEENNRASQNKVSVYDSKGRPLLAVKTLENGRDQWIFHRYVDMKDGEKKILREMHKVMKKMDAQAAMVDNGKETELDNLDDFLNFEEKKNDLCG